MTSFSEWADRALSLIFVPKCASCGERLPLDGSVLCPVCLYAYRDACERTCPVCGKKLAECLCAPPHLRTVGVYRLVKLFRYRSGEENAPENRMIYTLKHTDLRPLQRFLAHELAPSLARPIARHKADFCVTFPPRSQKALRRDGFDHAAAMARALARELDIPFLPTLVRVTGGEQKKLDRAARLQAAGDNYALRPRLSLSGRRVLLFDDVTTTGATLAATARLLRRGGAREVLCVALAVAMP